MRKGMNVQGSDQNDRDRAPAPEASSDLWATLLRAAWLAILLGLLMEVLLVALGGAAGGAACAGLLATLLHLNRGWRTQLYNFETESNSHDSERMPIHSKPVAPATSRALRFHTA